MALALCRMGGAAQSGRSGYIVFYLHGFVIKIRGVKALLVVRAVGVCATALAVPSVLQVNAVFQNIGVAGCLFMPLLEISSERLP